MKDNVVTGSVGGIKPQRPHSRHQAALLYIDSVSNKVKHKFHPCFIHPWVGVFPFHINCEIKKKNRISPLIVKSKGSQV